MNYDIDPSDILVYEGHSPLYCANRVAPMLRSHLQSAGFTVEHVRGLWARDQYVFASDNGKGVYLRRQDSRLGDGGPVLVGDGYFLISPRVGHSDFSSLRMSQDEVRAGFQSKFPGWRTYFLPWLPDFNTTGHRTHIDVCSLLLPKHKLLFLDHYSGHAAPSPDSLDSICDKEGLKVCYIDSSSDAANAHVRFALNALVLPRDGSEVAFVDEKAWSVRFALLRFGVPYVPVLVHPQDEGDGGIRCATNIALKSDNVDKRFLFVRETL